MTDRERAWRHATLAPFWEAQRRNAAAMIAAHRITFAGYRDAYVRLLKHCTEATADFRDGVETMQGQRLDADNASRVIAEAGRAFERSATELRLLGETLRAATVEGLEILRLRADEAAAEMRMPLSRSS